jgi:hypothetical protein
VRAYILEGIEAPEVGVVDDPSEYEADRVADRVVRMPAPEVSTTAAPLQVSRKCAECENDENLQKKSVGLAYSATGKAPAFVHDVLRSPGRPLDSSTRAYFEPRFGRDFSGVRVHADANAEQSARDLNAYAYTVGQDLVFAAGRYAPGTDEGRWLLAHELTHVVQQRNWSASAPVPHVVRRKAADDKTGDYRTAVVQLTWERDLDGAGFVDRLVAVISENPAFRSVAQDHMHAALMIPGGKFFTDHQFSFSTGQQVHLKISASFDSGDLGHMWVTRTEQASGQEVSTPDATTESPKSKSVYPQNRAQKQPAYEEADGIVELSGGKVLVQWLEPKSSVPDERRIFNLIWNDVAYGHPRGEPAEDRKYMAFVRSSPGEKWFLRPGFRWPLKQNLVPSPASQEDSEEDECSENNPDYGDCLKLQRRDLAKEMIEAGEEAFKEAYDPYGLSGGGGGGGGLLPRLPGRGLKLLRGAGTQGIALTKLQKLMKLNKAEPMAMKELAGGIHGIRGRLSGQAIAVVEVKVGTEMRYAAATSSGRCGPTRTGTGWFIAASLCSSRFRIRLLAVRRLAWFASLPC